MPLIWDRNNIEHIARHNVAPHEVEEALESFTVELNYQQVDGEDRFRDVGMTASGRLIEVISVERGAGIRPITAFDAGEAAIREYLRNR